MSKKNNPKDKLSNAFAIEPIWLKYGWVILIFVSIACWFSSINLGLTQLDDAILIGNREYLASDWKNIFHLFKVGCFHDKDVYYRPILSIYFFITNYIFGTESMMPYHFLSVLIHTINVLLVFKFLQKIILNKENAFLLTLIFAIHPAFTMAVSWVPGVNDLLLMMFAMIYFLALIKYLETSKIVYAIILILFLWIAFFTKENAVFLPFAGLLILWLKNYFNKINLNKIISVAVFTIVGLAIWYFMRKPILKADAELGIDYRHDFLIRIMAIAHYFGKAILPINLTTVPTSEDVANWIGLLSIVVVVILIYLNKVANKQNIVFGMAWFLILFMMIWAVHTHNKKNIIEYEHRLYLPFIGILFLLNESVIFKKENLIWVKRCFVIGFVMISFVVINNYAKAFNDAESFWSNAVNHSSNTAFALVSLGSRQLDAGKNTEAIINFKRAFAIDSTEKYVGFYLARTVYIPEKKLALAKYYIEKSKKETPNFSDLYIALAQINFYENDFIAEEKNLEKCVSLSGQNIDASKSLYNLSLSLHHYQKAKIVAKKLINAGIQINQDELQLIDDSIKVMHNNQ
ncbi:MAG: hypothetical protein RJA07_1781 [Bacteroidota bacterium]